MNKLSKRLHDAWLVLAGKAEIAPTFSLPITDWYMSISRGGHGGSGVSHEDGKITTLPDGTVVFSGIDGGDAIGTKGGKGARQAAPGSGGGGGECDGANIGVSNSRGGQQPGVEFLTYDPRDI